MKGGGIEIYPHTKMDEMKMTPERSQTYVENNGKLCPFCNSLNHIAMDEDQPGLSEDCSEIHIDMRCSECKYMWREIWKMVKIVKLTLVTEPLTVKEVS